MKRFLYLIKISLMKFVANWQYHKTGLDNGLEPNRQRAIICTNADPNHWRIYAALGGGESS